LELLRAEFPAIRVIAFDRNYGFAEGYNRVMSLVATEYVVMLNSDVEVTSGWLDVPLCLLESDSSIAGVQPKILSYRDRTYFEYAGGSGGYIDRYGYPYCRGRIFDVVEEDTGQYDDVVPVFWVSGACFFVRVSAYLSVGGMDVNFFAHQEEIDMCWRMLSRGYRLLCTPGSVVYHVGGATLGKSNARKTYLNFRNNLLMLYKNVPADELINVMLFRFFAVYLALLQHLVCGRFSHASAILRARWSYRKLCHEYKAIRFENLSLTSVTSIPERCDYSVLLRYYLRRNRYYHELVP
jgi:GT2 family glycosyltransferase